MATLWSRYFYHVISPPDFHLNLTWNLRGVFAGRLGMKIKEGRLSWYGHVMRRDQEYVRRRMMEMELAGKRKRGRPKRRFLDVVKEDMGEVGAKETDVEDRKVWRMIIRCGHP